MQSLKSMLPHLHGALHEFWIQWKFDDHRKTGLNGAKKQVMQELCRDTSQDGKDFREIILHCLEQKGDSVDEVKVRTASSWLIRYVRTHLGFEEFEDMYGGVVNG